MLHNLGKQETPSSRFLFSTKYRKKPFASKKDETQTMPRDPAPFLTVLQSSRLLSGWLSSFTLPLWSLCLWGWDCHHHTAASHSGARQLSTAAAGHAGVPTTGQHLRLPHSLLPWSPCPQVSAQIPEEEKGQASALLPFKSPGPSFCALWKGPASSANPILFQA